eukprot:COSAG06_NODE_3940_length_4742_cov_3.387680_3_plen_84_part_00
MDVYGRVPRPVQGLRHAVIIPSVESRENADRFQMFSTIPVKQIQLSRQTRDTCMESFEGRQRGGVPQAADRRELQLPQLPKVQ